MRTARSYQREIKKLKNLLADVMWVQPMYNGSPSCSCCRNQQHMGHADDCELAKLFAARSAIVAKGEKHG